jgi:hypothetical protein
MTDKTHSEHNVSGHPPLADIRASLFVVQGHELP